MDTKNNNKVEIRPTIDTQVIIKNLNPVRGENESYDDYKYRIAFNNAVMRIKRRGVIPMTVNKEALK